MLTAFIVDDDSFSVEATYMMIPWKELGVSHIEKIYSPTGLSEHILKKSLTLFLLILKWEMCQDSML